MVTKETSLLLASVSPSSMKAMSLWRFANTINVIFKDLCGVRLLLFQAVGRADGVALLIIMGAWEVELGA